MITAQLTGYRCYFIGPDGHIVDRVDYKAENDDHAVIEARARYAESRWNAGFEVWDLARLVYRAKPRP
jgi:hypothetical protein